MEKGTLITRGKTTVQPALTPTLTPHINPVTHITVVSSAKIQLLAEREILKMLPVLCVCQEW